MPIRKAHGTAARCGAIVGVEPLPADELPLGVQAPKQEESTGERTASGRWTSASRTAQRAGGKARAGSTRLARKLGLSAVPQGDFEPYLRAARDFRRAQCQSLAANVGGGYCGPGPSSIIASASLALAWSRYLSDRAAVTGDAELATRAVKMGADSKQMLLTAHELCAKEGEARAERQPDIVEQIRVEVEKELAAEKTNAE
jgi:hypothetical protein